MKILLKKIILWRKKIHTFWSFFPPLEIFPLLEIFPAPEYFSTLDFFPTPEIFFTPLKFMPTPKYFYYFFPIFLLNKFQICNFIPQKCSKGYKNWPQHNIKLSFLNFRHLFNFFFITSILSAKKKKITIFNSQHLLTGKCLEYLHNFLWGILFFVYIRSEKKIFTW